MDQIFKGRPADPDPLLAGCQEIAVTADSEILNRVERWFNLARSCIERDIPDAWVIDLGASGEYPQ